MTSSPPPPPIPPIPSLRFPAVPSSLYRVRCHFTELVLESNRTRLLNVAINGEDVAMKIDIHGLVGIDAALFQDYHALIHTDTLTVHTPLLSSPLLSSTLLSSTLLFPSAIIYGQKVKWVSLHKSLDLLCC